MTHDELQANGQAKRIGLRDPYMNHVDGETCGRRGYRGDLLVQGHGANPRQYNAGIRRNIDEDWNAEHLTVGKSGAAATRRKTAGTENGTADGCYRVGRDESA